METDRQTSARVHRVRIQHEEDENRPSPARWEPISMPTSFGKCAATGEPSIAPSTPTVWARRRHPVGNWRKRREFAEDAYAPGIEEFGGSLPPGWVVSLAITALPLRVRRGGRRCKFRRRF